MQNLFINLGFLILLIFSSSFSTGNINSIEERIKKPMDIFLDSIFTKQEMPALSVLITKDGGIIYENNLGVKDIKKNDSNNKLSSNDLFRIASISKSFVSTIIFRLIEENKLSLEDDVQKYLSFPLRNPTFPDIPITIDMLLTHTSSLQEKNRSIDIIIPHKNSDYYKSYASVKPGEQYIYCNLGYNILGAIIENVTQTRFDTIVNEYIINPLSLTASFNPNDLDPDKFVKAYLYSKKKNSFIESKDAYNPYKEELSNYVLGESTSILFPCAGMKISTRDLARYMDMHMNYGTLENIEILTNKSEETMREDYPEINNNYGRGICKYKKILPKKTFFGGTGGSYGIKSAMLYEPETKIGFIIISSGSNIAESNGAKDIHKPIIKEFYKIYDFE